MTNDLTAIASITIAAPPATVWKALTDPDIIEKYYFGARVETDWKVGSPISWHGEHEGSAYHDHGTILDVEPERLLRNTHFSPAGGRADIPENYHTLTYRLEGDELTTEVTLTQDNNPDYDAVNHSEKNWHAMLEGLKTVVES